MAGKIIARGTERLSASANCSTNTEDALNGTPGNGPNPVTKMRMPGQVMRAFLRAGSFDPDQSR
jgi:hypothetical protein